jgi:hypothetical protein
MKGGVPLEFAMINTWWAAVFKQWNKFIVTKKGISLHYKIFLFPRILELIRKLNGLWRLNRGNRGSREEGQQGDAWSAAVIFEVEGGELRTHNI